MQRTMRKNGKQTTCSYDSLMKSAFPRLPWAFMGFHGLQGLQGFHRLPMASFGFLGPSIGLSRYQNVSWKSQGFKKLTENAIH